MADSDRLATSAKLTPINVPRRTIQFWIAAIAFTIWLGYLSYLAFFV